MDGLRGIAALIVVLHHALLVVPALAAPYYDQGPAAQWTMAWWLSHTPIHVLWEGKAAVYVFFILSGLVLAQMVIKRDQFNWRAYYPQRLARLYIPVWAATLFTIATFWLVPRTGSSASAWLDERPETVTLMAFIKDMTLILGNGGLASPLWSLRFEILFSLALPLYIWASRKLPKLSYVKIALCLGIITVGGYLDNTAFLYAPMFLIGTVMATEAERFRALAGWIGRRRFGWPFVTTAAVLLMASSGMIGGLGVSAGIQGTTAGPTTIGAGILVMAAMHWAPAKNLLEKDTVQWLGAVSFSLYLVHEPIVVALGFLFGSDLSIFAVLVAIPVSLLVAAAFRKFIEVPSLNLSHKLQSRSAERALNAQ